MRSAGLSFELYLADADPEAIERTLAPLGERTDGGAIRLPRARALATRWPKAVMVSLPLGSPDGEALQLFTELARAAQAGGYSLRLDSPSGPNAGPEDLLAALQAARGQREAATGESPAAGSTGGVSTRRTSVDIAQWIFASGIAVFAAVCIHSWLAASAAASRAEPYHDWVFDLWDRASSRGTPPLIIPGALAALWALVRTAVILSRREYNKAVFWVPLALGSVVFLWWAARLLYGAHLLLSG